MTRRWWMALLATATVAVVSTASCRTLPEPELLPPLDQPAGAETDTGPPEFPAATSPPPASLRVIAVAQETVPLWLRVGLATDRPVARFAAGEGPLTARAGGPELLAAHALEVRPAADETRPMVYRLQVAALEDPVHAQELASRLERDSGHPADVAPDIAAGLFKVRVGRFPDRQAADTARRELRRHGVFDSFVVPEGGALLNPALAVVGGGRSVRAAGRWLTLQGLDGTVVIEGRRYRGRALVYLNDRGTLNVINEVSLEDYLRGVVPRELGPALYPELEALKAQTVAARTYTVRNLGEFLEEGFDLCATPRCQVYGGVGDEHPLSDRAVQETAGEVLLWRDEPIEALYSSTCGGHTENVGAVFPLKSDLAYLRGVPCVEANGASGRGSDVKWSSWRRFRTDAQLAQSVRLRYPGFPFRSFEIVERGVSGRAVKIRLLGDDGSTELVEGLAVRWTLDLPDLQFTASRRAPRAGESGWLFTGRGWGHGVGLCQVGAFGMARRGQSYQEILTHYYTGVGIGEVSAVRRVVRQEG